MYLIYRFARYCRTFWNLPQENKKWLNQINLSCLFSICGILRSLKILIFFMKKRKLFKCQLACVRFRLATNTDFFFSADAKNSNRFISKFSVIWWFLYIEQSIKYSAIAAKNLYSLSACLWVAATCRCIS